MNVKDPADQKILGRRLLRVWAVLSVLYVLAIAGCSIEPIREASRQPRAGASSTSALHQVPSRKHEDDLFAGRPLAKVLVIRVGLAGVPPLLALWFGWDLWFAIIGFVTPAPPPEADT